ncbi:MAG: DUF6368 family protein [Bradymonadales bacterium]|jgi:hypothetical protein
MELWIYFFSAPDASALQSLDRWFAGISTQQQASHSGIRLWISRMPSTERRPFLEPEAFDIEMGRAILTQAEKEAFMIATGASPQRVLKCKSKTRSSLHMRIVIELALGILQRCGGLLALHEGERELIEKILSDNARVKSCRLATLPGKVYEFACEREDGELQILQLVDSRHFKMWYQQMAQGDEKLSSDLPYSRRAAGLDL